MQGKSLWITLTPKVLPRTVERRELQELVPSKASPKGRTLCVPFIWIFKFKTKISNIAIRLIDELIVIVYIRDFPRMRTDWLAKTLVTVT